MNHLFARRWLTAIAAFACITPVFAVETRFWQQGDFSDFEKGNLKNLSLRSDGRLTLAPALKELFDTSTPYLWAAALDSKGNVYVGGGSPSGSSAKLFQIAPSGATKTIAELDGLEIHSIAVDKQDRVYAATVPDGKIYRVAPSGKPELFFDPKAKYIWAMAFASNGDLFVATGDRGEIFRVPPDGKGSVFFKTEETHARSLAIDAKDNLVIGTEPGGLIIRVTPSGQGFVLYQGNKREVTAVAVAADGSIYAAAVGSKPTSSATTPAAPAPAPTPPPAVPAPATREPGATAQRAPVVSTAPPTLGPAAPSVSGGSEIYRIDPDGSPRRVWQNAQDIVYALAFDNQGRPVFGTGNKGDIYRLDSDLAYTLLENVPPTQVTAFATGHNGNLYAVTGNVGKVFQIGPALEPQGIYESEVFDAGAFSYWGRLIFKADPKTGIGFEARSGNVNHAQKNWSPWMAVPVNGDGGRIEAPPARFLQYRATLRASSNPGPELSNVDLAYMAKNIAPVIEEIEITPANYKFSTPALTLSTAGPNTISLPPMGQKKKTPSPLDLTSVSSQSMTYSKGSAGARWSATDENGDTLAYKVEIKGVKESEWKLLKDNVRDKHFVFDSTAFPDGEYVLRVTASDSPDNPPDQALTALLVSDPFLIDNTPPEVTGLTGSVSGGKLNVAFTAKDALSLIDKAEYSINGGEWIVVEPTTRLSDSPDLQYRISIKRPGSGEVTVAVRATDEYDNQAVQKVVIR